MLSVFFNGEKFQNNTLRCYFLFKKKKSTRMFSLSTQFLQLLLVDKPNLKFKLKHFMKNEKKKNLDHCWIEIKLSLAIIQKGNVVVC